MVVCGGGFTGIELAADLPGRLRGILGEDTKVRVVVVEAADAVGPDLGVGPRPVITEALAELGVEVKTSAAVTSGRRWRRDYRHRRTHRGSHSSMDSRCESDNLDRPDSRREGLHGRIYVDSDLRVPQAKDGFVAGDAAHAATDDQGNLAMMSCQHAMPLGRAAGNNAAADLLGIATRSYSQSAYGTCLDLGAYGAVVTGGWDRQVMEKGLEGQIHQAVD